MADVEEGRRKAIRAVEACLERYHLIAAQRHHKDFDHMLMKNLKIIDAGPEGSVVYELHMSLDFSNLNDVMHGGAAGVIFDMATTTALCPLARPGYWEFMGGVTRTLNISYLRAVPIGTTVRLSSRVVSVGKQMALIQGAMTSLDGKVTYCTAEHHKVNAPPKEGHLGFRVKWDEEFAREWEGRGEAGTKAKI